MEAAVYTTREPEVLMAWMDHGDLREAGNLIIPVVRDNTRIRASPLCTYLFRRAGAQYGRMTEETRVRRRGRRTWTSPRTVSKTNEPVELYQKAKGEIDTATAVLWPRPPAKTRAAPTVLPSASRTVVRFRRRTAHDSQR